MKKRSLLAVIMIMAVAMLVMASCGKSELSGNVKDEKSMTITAVNSDKGDYFVTGTLEADEDDSVTIEAELEKGSIQIEFIASAGEGSAEEVPDIGGEATYTAYVSGEDEQTVSLPEGDYMVKVTVTEKATGTVEISLD